MCSLLATLDGGILGDAHEEQDRASVLARMWRIGPTECTPSELVAHLRRGGSWIGGAFEPSADGFGAFTGQQVFGAAFNGYLERIDLSDALRRCARLGLAPFAWYPIEGVADDTRGFGYVLIFDMGKAVRTERGACALIADLLHVFGEADQSLNDPSSLFPRSNGEAHDLRELWEDGAAWAI